MKHRKFWLALLVLAGSLWTASFAAAAPVRIKFATLAPKGTAWYESLNQMREEFAQVSNNQVQMRIYPGGVAGEEADMIRKMRIGQLHAAGLTSFGMGKIDNAMRSFALPMMFRSYQEVDYVLEKLGPELDALLLKKGFVVLHWTDAGWLHFFSTKPVRSPADLKPLKVSTSPDTPEMAQIWNAMGFQPVPLANQDVLLGLQNGLADFISTSPLFALSQQWFGVAQYMTDIPWVPMFGGTIVSRRIWEKIPANMRPQLKQIAQRIGLELRQKIRGEAPKVLEAMTSRGLNVVKPSPAELADWQKLVDNGTTLANKEQFFSEEWAAKIRKVRDEFRASNP